MRVGGGGTVENTLKGGGTKKRGGETKILKRGIKLGQGVVALKGGAGTPLRTMIGFLFLCYVRMYVCVYICVCVYR